MNNSASAHTPVISVLMPCYNAAEYMREAIDSVLDQTYTDFELICINDGSTDDTQMIIDEYAENDKRIRSITKENSGLPDSLNAGLEKAGGEWIARLDADDVAFPYRFEQQMAYINQNKGTVLLGSGCVIIDSSGNEVKRYRYPAGHSELMKYFRKKMTPFPHSSAVFSKDTAAEAGNYSTRFHAGEDIDLWLRMSTCGSIACLSDALIKLRKHSGSITARKWKDYTIMGFAAVICHMRGRAGLSRPSDMDTEYWKRFLAWIEDVLDRRNYFEESETWNTIKEVWYDTGCNPVAKGYVLLLKGIQHPLLCMKRTRDTLLGTDLAEKLSMESREKWPE